MVRKILGVLWLPLMVFIGEIIFLFKYNPEYLEDPTNYPTMLLLSTLPSLLSWASSLGKPSEKKSLSGKEKAKYPPIPKELLHKDPTGTIVFGRDKHSGCFVCKKITEPGHVFIIGGSGSGKSSCLIIPSILSNKNHRTIAIDIKGELHEKATKYGDETVFVLDPQDRGSYGYNPLYQLSDESTTQEILEVMQTISISLISMPPDIKEPFWRMEARNMLIGLLMYGFRQGYRDLPTMADFIEGQPIKELIAKVLSELKPSSVEYKYLVQYGGMADETISGVPYLLLTRISGTPYELTRTR